MTASTLTPEAAPAAVEACEPWCAEHWDGDDLCWAPDLVFQVHPAADDTRGRITVMMTHNPRPNPRSANRSRNVTLFIDAFPDGEQSTDMDPAEAEVAAHALLAMVALARGRTVEAAQHREVAEQVAAALLAHRGGGAS